MRDARDESVLQVVSCQAGEGLLAGGAPPSKHTTSNTKPPTPHLACCVDDVVCGWVDDGLAHIPQVAGQHQRDVALPRLFVCLFV